MALAADDGTHRRIASQPLGVVHVLVAGQPAEHGLSKQPTQLVAQVLPAAAIDKLGDRDIGEPKGIVQLTVG